MGNGALEPIARDGKGEEHKDQHMLTPLCWPQDLPATVWQHLIPSKDENPKVQSQASHGKKSWRVVDHLQESWLRDVLPRF